MNTPAFHLVVQDLTPPERLRFAHFVICTDDTAWDDLARLSALRVTWVTSEAPVGVPHAPPDEEA